MMIGRWFVHTMLVFLITFISVYQSIHHESQFDPLVLELAYGQTRYLDYNNPFEMMRVEYPSFWNVSEDENTGTVSFTSPLPSVGVLIQNKFTGEASLDETLMDTISKLRTSLKDVQILNTDVVETVSESATQALLFTYEQENIQHKILIFIKEYGDRLMIFSYYSENKLFDRFLPIAQHMYNTLKTPKLESVFESDAHFNTLNQYQEEITPTQVPDPEKLSPYSNNELGFSTFIPSSWERQESDNGILFSSSNDSLGITVARLQMLDDSFEDFVKNHLNTLNQSLSDFEVINMTVNDLFGYPTPMILFTYSNQSQEYNVLQLWKMANNSVFVFTYYAGSQKLFDDFLPTIADIIESTRIEDINH
jgi:hypothetical protein